MLSLTTKQTKWTLRAERQVGDIKASFFSGVMEVFEQIPTERELVFQARLLCREFMYSRITREGLSWSAVDAVPPAAPAALTHAALVLLKLGKKPEHLRPPQKRLSFTKLHICSV